MDKQAREAKQMAKELPFREKIPYIWMYYKYWIISALVVLILGGSTVYQIATRPSYDLEIGFYSEKMLSDEAVVALEQYLAEFVDDVDGDGEKTVKIYTNFSSIVGGGAEGVYAIQTKLVAELTAGQYPVFLFDDAFSEQMQLDTYAGAMEPLHNLEEVPAMHEILNLPEGTNIYWGTRALYEPEQDKEERIAEYNRTVALENAIFGEQS